MEGRSRSGVPQEVRPVVPVTTSSQRLSFRARSSHCQVLALPLTHSPEGGGQWCQITGGAHPTTSGRMVSVPVSGTGCTTHVRYDVGGGGRLQMEWNTCTYSYNLLERLNVSRNVQPRHFLIELFRREIDIVVVSPEAGLEEVCRSRT